MKELGKSTGEAWEEVVAADKMWDDFKTGPTDAQSKSLMMALMAPLIAICKPAGRFFRRCAAGNVFP